MDLHSGEQIIFKGRPSWRSILLFYITGILIAAGAGFAASLIEDDSTLGVAVGVGVFVVVLIVGFIKRIATQYLVTNERLHIRRGLIARHVQETRLERVQNVNTDQGVMERILQIGTVDFDTAGTTDSDFSFTGIAQPERVVQAVYRAHRAQAEAQAQAAQAQSAPAQQAPPSPPAPPAPPADAPSATAE